MKCKKYFRLKYLSIDHSIHTSFNCVIHNSNYIKIIFFSYIDIYSTFYTIDIDDSMQHYINNKMIKKKINNNKTLWNWTFPQYWKTKTRCIGKTTFLHSDQVPWNTNLTSIIDLDPSLTLTSDLDITAQEQSCIT